MEAVMPMLSNVYNGSKQLRPGMLEPRNVVHPDSFHGNSEKDARGLRHFVTGKGIVGWKLIHYPQGRVVAFEVNF